MDATFVDTSDFFKKGDSSKLSSTAKKRLKQAKFCTNSTRSILVEFVQKLVTLVKQASISEYFKNQKKRRKDGNNNNNAKSKAVEKGLDLQTAFGLEPKKKDAEKSKYFNKENDIIDVSLDMEEFFGEDFDEKKPVETPRDVVYR